MTIAEMFGAISYNKPNPEHANDRFEFYESFYQSRMEPKASNPYALENIMKLYLNKIITIDNGGTLKDPPIGLKSEYYNTFWLINDNIIPSSVIIQNIIDRVYDIDTHSLVDIKLNNIEETKATPVWPNEPAKTANLASMANRWKIDYTTTFDFTEIMKSIDNSLK